VCLDFSWAPSSRGRACSNTQVLAEGLKNLGKKEGQMTIKSRLGQVCKFLPVMPAFRRERQENRKFQPISAYIVRPHLNKESQANAYTMSSVRWRHQAQG
jgi:hypothetical protein